MVNPLYDTLFGAHVNNSATFLRFSNGASLSYQDFLAMASRFAGFMKNAGLKQGDRVAVQVEKSAEALAVYAACAQSGLVFLPLNPAYTPSEVSYFIENSGASLVIGDSANAAALVPIAKRCSARFDTLNADGSGSYADAAKDHPNTFKPVECGEDDIAALLYTSGTTGRSKGAMLSQRNLVSNAQVLRDEWRFTARDTLLHALPIFHTHGLFVATNITLLAGGQMILLPKFDQDDMIAAMPDATALMGVPTFYTRLLADARFDKDLVRHMRLFISGSAPLLAETHVQFEHRTGHRILERYGMTETNMSTSNPYDGTRRAGTVGFPLPGVDLKITDSAGTALPPGDVGIIEVRGPNVFQGYWQMPEKTSAELREDGFFITGDLGRLDDDGYLTIVGREKDLVISGGFNIYPKEVELLLDDQPGVLESAVIGAPHPDFGEAVVGVLVAEDNADVDLDHIARVMANKLARFKQPKQLIIVSELPRNSMGKVQKNVLRDRFAGLFADI